MSHPQQLCDKKKKTLFQMHVQACLVCLDLSDVIHEDRHECFLKHFIVKKMQKFAVLSV